MGSGVIGSTLYCPWDFSVSVKLFRGEKLLTLFAKMQTRSKNFNTKVKHMKLLNFPLVSLELETK